METPTKFIVGDDTECINCGEIIYPWYDEANKEMYWATDMNRSTCGRSANFHIPMTR